MHNSQRPLSALNVIPLKKDFPSLQHFWPCTESNIDTALVDIIGDVTTGLVTITNADGIKMTTQQATAGTPISKGVLKSPGSKVTVVMTVGDLNTVSGILAIGAAPVQGGTGSLQILGISSKYQATDTVDVGATVGSVFGSAPEAHALVFFPAVSVTGYKIDSLNTFSINGTPDTTNIPTLTDINQSTAFGNGTASSEIVDLHGVAVFFFDAIPTDLELAMQWMKAQWLIGNKAIYPGWKDKL